jgi:chromosome segregation protein
LPVSFSRLRIAGFKSFAEPATVEILPGLTGIVGPNGCGKSNVVEALRWMMGENSARTMRGTEMDDVIFAGTAARPARNIAEVTLRLEDTAGAVPPPFHEHAELEVSRRIERGNGSAYRVNGREIRARDVQTLFADMASGARSSAMVSQGRVAAIVGARPEDRRSVLEEAAGITGLHARRHEAELKLRAAEANLGRAEDLRGQLETQLGALKRQARQASRYRNISGAVRQAEAELLALQRARVETARAAAKSALHEAGLAVAAATEAATRATALATDSAAELPPLRETEATARTALERHRLAQEQIAAEESRALAALAEAERRLSVLSDDLAHAERACRDAEAAATRLDAEAATLADQEAGYPQALAAAEAACAVAADAVHAAEIEANRATDAAAQAAAASQAALQARQAAEQRARRIGDLTAQTEREHAQLQPQAVDPAALAQAEAAQSAAEAALAAARADLDRAEHARAAAQTTLAAARERQAATASTRAGLAAEARALAEVLAVKDNEQWPPMVDALGVPPGLEAALGATLGEELSSAADREAARHWRELPPIDPAPALPLGSTPLATLVDGPPALGRALSQIGLAADDAAGDAAQPALAPGQMLVTRQGAVWRWDGYTIRAGTQTAAAIRLQQRNRLRELRAALADAGREAAAAETARAEAAAAEAAAVQDEQRARAARRAAEQSFEQLRNDGARLRAQADRVAARLSALADQLARQQEERAEANAALAAAQEAAASLPDLVVLRAAVEQTRATLAAARTRDAAGRAAADGLKREHTARTTRAEAVARERTDWTQRAADAGTRAADLTARRTEAETHLSDLRDAPTQIAERRSVALDALDGAEATHRRAGDALQEAAARAAAADRAARAAEQALAAARENAVRAEGAVVQADHDWGTVAERIIERLGADPALPDPPADLSPESEEKARRRLERLLREREEMGPVNLRADVEAEAVETQMATIVAERDELTAAIAKLRGSIGHLNREGRERLSAVFQEVDRAFQTLFTRVFGGGRAHLALVGSDDPLIAGLEIYAQPPGKKLATLSLLSGGEQALTALSLIFAVFRCNPAPVCVLDEVDAPLDDANVDRFCTLLEDLVRESATRFLVVTHHPMTMARMDRLYGVTMQERGVSRLLSVDLQTAAAIVDPPRMAAE